MISAAGRFARRWALAAPGAVWVVVFLLLPAVVMVAAAFARKAEYGEIEWTVTAENFARFVDSREGVDLLRILGRSVWISFVTTVLSVLLAYPLAFWIARQRAGVRYTLLAVVMVPFCINIVVRLCAWKVVLSKDLLLAKMLAAMGLVEHGDNLYPGTAAVYIGMISSFLPFAVLPIYTNVERLDWSIVEAAEDLYASSWGVFRHAVLPQTSAGLSAAIVLTFVPAMGTFVVTDMLAGGKYALVGNLIQQQFSQSSDLPYGSALSVGLMVLTLVPLALFRRRGAGLPGGGS